MIIADSRIAVEPEVLDICSKLKNSKVYVRTPLQVKFPKPAQLSKIQETDEQLSGKDKFYELKTFRTLIGNISGKVQAFPCKTHENITFWMAYNQMKEHRIFLLHEANDNGLAFVGQAEPTPKIDDKYTEGAGLDDYFIKTYRCKKIRSHYNEYLHNFI